MSDTFQVCPSCGQQVSFDNPFCPNCQAVLPEPDLENSTFQEDESNDNDSKSSFAEIFLASILFIASLLMLIGNRPQMSGGELTGPSFFMQTIPFFYSSYTIPKNVTSIRDNAFQNCENLKSVTIPPKVKHIGENAFSGSKKLTIYGKNGSAAESYAQRKGFKFAQMTEKKSHRRSGPRRTYRSTYRSCRR